mmetsp:Transcript_33989/g.79496  ORF Transcript_33989/g.79496 Transcript_33989/m.79496 type:complete len:612 (-) Transcript_33989:108-1943(-)
MDTLFASLETDSLLCVCLFLVVKELVALTLTSRAIQITAEKRELVLVWRGLCSRLLGEAFLVLHESAWGRNASDVGTVAFYKRLFKTVWRGDGSLCFDNQSRHLFLQNLRNASPEAQTASEYAFHEILKLECHTAEAIGRFVVHIGSMQLSAPSMAAGPAWVARATLRPQDLEVEHSESFSVAIADLATMKMFRPTLAPGSAKPQQRSGSASCVVKAPCFSSNPAYPEAVLLLGGLCFDKQMARGPIQLGGRRLPGLRSLLFLEIMREDGSQIAWKELSGCGEAPESLVDLAAVPFDDGRKVCVFGGYMEASDREILRMWMSPTASFVYILHIANQHWERVATSGLAPSWRKGHIAVGWARPWSPVSHECLIMFGGMELTADAARAVNDMRAYELDLSTFRWRCGPGCEQGRSAQPRQRGFAVARWGRHVVACNDMMAAQEEGYWVERLNLTTLVWDRVRFDNKPIWFPSGPPVGGCSIGFRRGLFLPSRAAAQLAVMRFRDPANLGADVAETEAVVSDWSHEGDPYAPENWSASTFLQQLAAMHRPVGPHDGGDVDDDEEDFDEVDEEDDDEDDDDWGDDDGEGVIAHIAMPGWRPFLPRSNSAPSLSRR